ncbi:MAG: serine hydroxymethyltransferase [Desulfurococcales archaeon ex4484_217_1]|nr:MAG: serine hydroxymethyltransferase [Desulfurococcales archaeon ex4484_217_1]
MSEFEKILKEFLPEEVVKVIKLTASHNRWRKRECLNMIPSENQMSPLAEMVYLTDMGHRYAEGLPYKRYYQGLIYVDEMEVYAQELMSKLFHVKYVDLRPISGTIANLTAYYAMARYGDKAVVVPVQAGAHVSHTKYGGLGALGIQQIEMPFSLEDMNIDVDKAAKVIREVKPKFVTFGGSVWLFPHPVKELSEVAHEVGAKVMYDAAHVLGLIAGGQFQDPIKEGADIITSSTHKTFPGPQGGVILTNDEELYKKVRKIVFPIFVSNHHLHRLPATAIVALELLYFGKEYAAQIIKNAKALAEALAAEGFNVLGEKHGYTKSHQVLLDVRALGGGAKCAKMLEDANIIVNKNLLPYDKPEMIKDPSGLRLGAQELTRWGMKEDDMKEIARFFRRVLIDKEDPAKVRKDVIEFRKNFQKIHYTFDVPLEEVRKLLKLEALPLLE